MITDFHNRFFRIAAKVVQASFTSEFVKDEVDGVTIVQVNVNSGKTMAKIKGKEVLILWDDMYWEDKTGKKLTARPSKNSAKYSAYNRFVKWGIKQIKKSTERKTERKEWNCTKVNGYYVYDIESKEEVASVLANIDKDVKPLLKHFKISYTHIFETMAEGYAGFNKRQFGNDCIGLQVRQSSDWKKLKKYSAVMNTMIYELAHCRYRSHDKAFYDFMNEILAYAKAKGIYAPN